MLEERQAQMSAHAARAAEASSGMPAVNGTASGTPPAANGAAAHQGVQKEAMPGLVSDAPFTDQGPSHTILAQGVENAHHTRTQGHVTPAHTSVGAHHLMPTYPSGLGNTASGIQGSTTSSSNGLLPPPPAACSLFFGCRSVAADFYYGEQWQGMQAQGVLLPPPHGLVVAFSRDQPSKVRVLGDRPSLAVF